MLSTFKEILFGKSPNGTTPAGKINTTDVLKVTRTGLLVGLSGALTYVIANLSPEMFGDNKLVATVVLTILSELSLRLIKSNKELTK